MWQPEFRSSVPVYSWESSTHICNSSSSTVIWEVETGQPLGTQRSVTQKYTAENSKRPFIQHNRRQRLTPEGVLWPPCMHCGTWVSPLPAFFKLWTVILAFRRPHKDFWNSRSDWTNYVPGSLGDIVRHHSPPPPERKRKIKIKGKGMFIEHLWGAHTAPGTKEAWISKIALVLASLLISAITHQDIRPATCKSPSSFISGW